MGSTWAKLWAFGENAPLQDADWNLDISGVAGFFGGDVAVSAMATVHVYEGRKWLGFYNTPGSYEIAKRYGQLGRTRFWDGLYPGGNVDPAVLFELDGMSGPKYKAIHSGTIISKTGHLAHLFLQECKEIPPADVRRFSDMRKTTPVAVTIAELHYEEPETETHPHLIRRGRNLSMALFTVSSSMCTALACFFFHDWICASMISLGMIAGGVSCFVIGEGKFTFAHPKPAPGAPHGDGLLERDGEVVILKGTEGAVNPITRGKFSLKYTDAPDFHRIGCASLLLTLQFLAQLVLVPQGKLIGQLMFVISLIISWGYNSYLSSLDKESIQRRLLLENILRKPKLEKFELGTRTIMVVFVLLVLTPATGDTLSKLLDEMLPNDTHVWKIWKRVVLGKIASEQRVVFGERLEDEYAGETLSESEKQLLHTLFGDAASASRAFQEYQTM